MEQQKILTAYSILEIKKEYPLNADKILRYMYTSNRQFFTHEEFMMLLNADRETVNDALVILIHHNEIKCRMIEKTEEEYLFYLDVEKTIQSLKRKIKQHQIFTDMLEKEFYRDEIKDEDLNNFIKASILFNSEVTDFINQRIKEYFPIKTIKNEKSNS